MLAMDDQEIERHLGEARIGRLCMADVGGRPYTIPLPFLWHEGGLYLRLPLTGRKGEILRRNRQVCFETDEFTANFDHYASVIIEGELQPVTDLREKRRVKALNDAKYNRLRDGHRPGHGRTTPIEDLAMQRIVVKAVSGRKKV
jgi:nitroimidazol reductase NimA-like FMN-containing flavoprotein (pyridoxamine 5'-phosphate oxidase superfamily)